MSVDEIKAVLDARPDILAFMKIVRHEDKDTIAYLTTFLSTMNSIREEVNSL